MGKFLTMMICAGAAVVLIGCGAKIDVAEADIPGYNPASEASAPTSAVISASTSSSRESKSAEKPRFEFKPGMVMTSADMKRMQEERNDMIGRGSPLGEENPF